MSTLSRAIAAIGLSGLSLVAGAATVFNEDFSGAAVGQTDYAPEPSYGDGLNPTGPGRAVLLSDPAQYFKEEYNFAHYYDHTTGTRDGSMMFFDGAIDPAQRIWYTTVALTAGIQYFFSYWMASTSQQAPPTLAFSIDGTRTGSSLTTTDAGSWVNFATSFVPAVTGDAVLSITDLNTGSDYNDGTIDDISLTFEQMVGPGDPGNGNPIPEPQQAALMAGGLAVLAWMTRRRALPSVPDATMA